MVADYAVDKLLIRSVAQLVSLKVSLMRLLLLLLLMLLEVMRNVAMLLVERRRRC